MEKFEEFNFLEKPKEAGEDSYFYVVLLRVLSIIKILWSTLINKSEILSRISKIQYNIHKERIEKNYPKILKIQTEFHWTVCYSKQAKTKWASETKKANLIQQQN